MVRFFSVLCLLLIALPAQTSPDLDRGALVLVTERRVDEDHVTWRTLELDLNTGKFRLSNGSAAGEGVELAKGHRAAQELRDLDAMARKIAWDDLEESYQEETPAVVSHTLQFASEPLGEHTVTVDQANLDAYGKAPPRLREMLNYLVAIQ